MDTVGEFFRHVRETKGLTLDAVASKTCIHTDFLRALEDNNFTKLPDQVFAKGFVRSYARSLGLDEQEAMRRFMESAGPFYEKQGERERLRQKQVEDERKRKTSRQVAAAALAVGLLAIVLLLTREQSPVSDPRRTNATPPAKEASPPVGQPSRSATGTFSGQEPGKPAGPVSTPGPSAASPSPPAVDNRGHQGGSGDLAAASTGHAVAGADEAPLMLDIEALELTWVVVRIDGGAAQEALMRPGDHARWRADEQFALTLGNAGGVRIELNGKEQGPFGPKGKVARDILLKR